MSRSWTTVLLWAAFLGVLTAVTAPFGAGIYTWGLLGLAAVGTLAIALVTFAVNGRDDSTVSRPSARRAVSYPAMLLGVGVSAIALGAVVGVWLVFIGAGVTAIAVGGLVLEWREA